MGQRSRIACDRDLVSRPGPGKVGGRIRRNGARIAGVRGPDMRVIDIHRRHLPAHLPVRIEMQRGRAVPVDRIGAGDRFAVRIHPACKRQPGQCQGAVRQRHGFSSSAIENLGLLLHARVQIQGNIPVCHGAEGQIIRHVLGDFQIFAGRNLPVIIRVAVADGVQVILILHLDPVPHRRAVGCDSRQTQIFPGSDIPVLAGQSFPRRGRCALHDLSVSPVKVLAVGTDQTDLMQLLRLRVEGRALQNLHRPVLHLRSLGKTRLCIPSIDPVTHLDAVVLINIRLIKLRPNQDAVIHGIGAARLVVGQDNLYRLEIIRAVYIEMEIIFFPSQVIGKFRLLLPAVRVWLLLIDIPGQVQVEGADVQIQNRELSGPQIFSD